MLHINEVLDLDDIDFKDDEPFHVEDLHTGLGLCGAQPTSREIYDGPWSEFPETSVCEECVCLLSPAERKQFRT